MYSHLFYDVYFMSENSQHMHQSMCQTVLLHSPAVVINLKTFTLENTKIIYTTQSFVLSLNHFYINLQFSTIITSSTANHTSVNALQLLTDGNVYAEMCL